MERLEGSEEEGGNTGKERIGGDRTKSKSWWRKEEKRELMEDFFILQ